jgi:hypothetical protein
MKIFKISHSAAAASLKISIEEIQNFESFN